ncbi:hypothetical protein BGZ70_004442 [Mortierella alpina]|uniref:Uncharacterized protein n=1 Tax=Mortierella alpina TaxID=64518 RepID=A0A9P6LV64_MORAP|nr:hypothetical protein BGZ70_004442 [Mortierella alpina]
MVVGEGGTQNGMDDCMVYIPNDSEQEIAVVISPQESLNPGQELNLTTPNYHGKDAIVGDVPDSIAESKSTEESQRNGASTAGTSKIFTGNYVPLVRYYSNDLLRSSGVDDSQGGDDDSSDRNMAGASASDDSDEDCIFEEFEGVGKSYECTESVMA